MPAPRRGRWATRLAAAATGAAAAWAIVTARTAGGDAFPPVMLIVTAAAAYALSRGLAARSASVVPLVVMTGCLAAAGASAFDGDADPRDGVLGYTNADGALFVQGAAAAAMLALTRAPAALKIAGAGGVASLLALTLATGSFAASASAVALAVVVAAGGSRRPRLVAIGGAVAVAGVLATTVALGLSYPTGDPTEPLEGVVQESLSEERLALWHEALGLIADHPTTGVGPGRFRHESDIARADPDRAWVHNEFLQWGAETGVIGLLLLVAGVGAVFVALGASPAPPAAVGAAALTAVAVQASVDYVLHFPAVVIACAAVVGAASTWRKTGSETFPTR